MRISDWSSDVCSSDLKPEPGADHHAVVTCTGQLLFQHGAGALIGRDHAKVGLPAPFRDRGHRDLDPRVALRRIDARRDGRVGKVHGRRLLADAQYASPVVEICSASEREIVCPYDCVAGVAGASKKQKKYKK